MESVLIELKNIEKNIKSIGDTIRTENAVYKAELADRISKGLVGDAAIEHYNEWMQRYGMEHLIVK